MYLKRLEVIGFKSFAERIGIDFVPGVTAVVGPNGSGKSNVTDAIRWVLGEQSAKSLRGAKMEDIIFAGSDSRKPLNFAEVTLILDNTDERLPIDFSEVSVTRRVFRSGESEYLLNKQSCRLKDITDLFLDSGLGKEAFSIISQGRVDEILNSRPDERRSIFEEAAGVLKYKKRRKKAENKLFETDDNLHRVLDILHELDERIEPLQIQASTAQDFLAMKKDLREIDIAVLVHDIEEIEEKLMAILQNKAVVDNKELEQAASITKAEEQLKTLRETLTSVDTALDTDRTKLVEVSSTSERLQGDQKLFVEKQKNATDQLFKLQQSLLVATTKRDNWHKSLLEKETKLKMASEKLSNLKKEIKELENHLSRTSDELNADIEEKKSTYIDYLSEQAAANNELNSVNQQINQQLQSTEKMSSKSTELLTEQASVKEKLNEIEPTLQALKEEIAEQTKDFQATQADLRTATKQLEEKQKMLYEGYNHLQQLQSRRDTLAELDAEFAGFYQGVKAVLVAREKNQLQGISGAVAELIQVETEYTQAIETALGAAMQHIVTTTDVHAKSAIRYLKQQKSGRATFLPLNIMKSRKVSKNTIQAAVDHPSFINTADELVTFDEQYRKIAEHLLGHVIIAKDLDGAGQIAKFVNYRYRIVTLEGDVVNAGGSMTGGGSNKNQTTVFSRKAELEALQEKLSAMEATILQAEHVVADWKAKALTASTLLDVQQDHGEQLRRQENILETQQMQLQSTLKYLMQSLSIYGSEQEDSTSRHSELEMKKAALTAQLIALKQSLLEIDADIAKMTILKQQSELARDDLMAELANKREQNAQATGQVESIRLSTEETRNYFNGADTEVATLRREIDFVTQSDLPKEMTVEQLSDKIDKMIAHKEQLDATIQANLIQRTALQQKIGQQTIALKELQRIHQSMRTEQSTIEIALGRLDVQRDNAVEQLLTNYDLSFEEAMLEPAIDLDMSIARRKVNLLTQSIKELGAVNIAAIEEYETVAERHQFLTAQRNDLLEAKDTLFEAIQEMDVEMTSRFSATFKQIRIHFQDVFRELFGGGRADLELLDPENLLESGIEIVAQPPGKKLQNLGLLSGGERALTAIALLFAILKTRPVPFCILDEVEAALDESNVSRYSQYLKKFSDETQFIVITHRKGTMEGADVLYGITMQESGVSKLVSVKLEQETMS
ncbi:chromosome segregation protein SMC [Kurthia sibirica]|uniref:Chromosome partition protein Smc n=1 Tax=Kurthia sibirica TaxID=202750 RepID=A0A2U3AQT2_9BACL|nr:chromosome segregation protein SMC [Kurthia sibirica]PWI26869.1 chromosome segregation protein SMC [Kurthia sibirica]GEK32593.1 chromosome partition protein Smc [Kurthia sibirica]